MIKYLVKHQIFTKNSCDKDSACSISSRCSPWRRKLTKIPPSATSTSPARSPQDPHPCPHLRGSQTARWGRSTNIALSSSDPRVQPQAFDGVDRNRPRDLHFKGPHVTLMSPVWNHLLRNCSSRSGQFCAFQKKCSLSDHGGAVSASAGERWTLSWTGCESCLCWIIFSKCINRSEPLFSHLDNGDSGSCLIELCSGFYDPICIYDPVYLRNWHWRMQVFPEVF